MMIWMAEAASVEGEGGKCVCCKDVGRRANLLVRPEGLARFLE